MDEHTLLLTEIRDLLAEQNKLLSRVVAQNDQALNQSLEAATKADNFLSRSQSTNNVWLIAFIVFVLVMAAWYWQQNRQLSDLLGS